MICMDNPKFSSLLNNKDKKLKLKKFYIEKPHIITIEKFRLLIFGIILIQSKNYKF